MTTEHVGRHRVSPQVDPIRFRLETLQDIAQANLNRPAGAPEGDGRDHRPIWRDTGDSHLRRPGTSRR